MRIAAFGAGLALLLAGCSSGDGGSLFLDQQPEATVATAPVVEATPAVSETPAPSPPELHVNSALAAPGSSLVVTVRNTDLGGMVHFNERQYPLAHGDGLAWAVVGLGPDLPLGGHSLQVDLEDGNSFSSTIEAGDAGYLVENITLSGETSSLLTPDNAALEAQKVSEAYAVYTPERLWAGPFMLPIDTYITAGYGEARSYNGGPISSHHKGIDFGALEGTDVAAANSGRVIMAYPLPLSGNSVIIDHGLGVMTLYAHLVRIDVEEGQLVHKGDIVGGVGTTGISTGNHLHWGLLVHGVPVNPHQWIWTEVGPASPPGFEPARPGR
ncbi:MAG: peptidoglycan DD-metalloendopeptidase family protein [Dehalococcoidia bacterium]|nr:peptidoglycan DD-metalloendopeptidase family protein [Dehalococcoidia bacterium]